MTGPTMPALCLWPLLQKQLCRDAQAPPERLGEAGASPGSCCVLHPSSPLGAFSICSSKPSQAKASAGLSFPLLTSPSALTHTRPAGLPLSLMRKSCSWTHLSCAAQLATTNPPGTSNKLLSIPKFQVQGKGSFRKVLRVRSLVGQVL